MNKVLRIIIVAVLLCTAVAVVLHLGNQEEISCMIIKHGGNDIPITYSELDKTKFSGETINGKGDIFFHEYTGVAIRELLNSKNIAISNTSIVKVTSADNFSAEYTGEEILSGDRIYLAITEDGKHIDGIGHDEPGVQVIVFGDSNSRRCVRYAKIIEIE